MEQTAKIRMKQFSQKLEFISSDGNKILELTVFDDGDFILSKPFKDKNIL